MLYGTSPFHDRSAASLGLQPVMTLVTQLIAVQRLKRGDAVGYGQTWACPEAMPVGIAAVGYADGYPRHAPSGTPVLVRGARCPLVARVSMDMIHVDRVRCRMPSPGTP
jgi:alanine racemase